MRYIIQRFDAKWWSGLAFCKGHQNAERFTSKDKVLREVDRLEQAGEFGLSIHSVTTKDNFPNPVNWSAPI